MDESIVENMEIMDFKELNEEINGWRAFREYLDYHGKIVVSHMIYIMNCYIRLQNDLNNVALLLSLHKSSE